MTPLRAIRGGRREAVVLLVQNFEDATEGFRASLRALGPARARQEPARAISVEQARSLLTWPRLSLLRAIRKERPASIAALARAVNRSADDVTKDLQVLEQFGVVELRRPGGRSRTRVPVVKARDIEIRVEL